jgi:hypothetical protein
MNGVARTHVIGDGVGQSHHFRAARTRHREVPFDPSAKLRVHTDVRLLEDPGSRHVDRVAGESPALRRKPGLLE